MIINDKPTPYCRELLSEDELTKVKTVERTSAAARYLNCLGEKATIINLVIPGANFSVLA
jgi:hypothetical protein